MLVLNVAAFASASAVDFTNTEWLWGATRVVVTAAVAKATGVAGGVTGVVRGVAGFGAAAVDVPRVSAALTAAAVVAGAGMLEATGVAERLVPPLAVCVRVGEPVAAVAAVLGSGPMADEWASPPAVWPSTPNWAACTAW